MRNPTYGACFRPAILLATYKHIVCGGQWRTFTQTVDVMHIALAGSASPKMETGPFLCERSLLREFALSKGSLRPIHGQLYDTRNHY